ncbi:hypothetical protein ACFX2C_042569 [Malus domestica]
MTQSRRKISNGMNPCQNSNGTKPYQIPNGTKPYQIPNSTKPRQVSNGTKLCNAPMAQSSRLQEPKLHKASNAHCMHEPKLHKASNPKKYIKNYE